MLLKVVTVWVVHNLSSDNVPLCRSTTFIERKYLIILATIISAWRKKPTKQYSHQGNTRTKAKISHCTLPKFPAWPRVMHSILASLSALFKSGYLFIQSVPAKSLPSLRGGGWGEISNHGSRDLKLCWNWLNKQVTAPKKGRKARENAMHSPGSRREFKECAVAYFGFCVCIPLVRI